MKVMHLVPAMEQGGVETVVLNLVRELSGTAESVVVSKGGRLVERLVADGGRHVALDVKSKNPLTYFSRAGKLRKLLKAEKPDLVCVHSRVPAWLFVWANRGLGFKWITYAHGANSVSRYSEVMTKGDLTVTPSRFLADYLKANYGLAEERIRVINPAVDSKRFDQDNLDRTFVETKRREWGLAADDFVVMAVGRITEVKGYDTLIKAVRLLQSNNQTIKQSNNFRLVIVGDADKGHQDYLESLKALAAEAGLETGGVRRDVVFAGGESKIPECLSLASVVVSSNVKKPESFGLSMAEALMMGKPVVAKAFGGALDIVRDGIDGVLVPPGGKDDAAAFAAAIARVRDSDFGDLRASACGRFAVPAMTARTLACYRELLPQERLRIFLSKELGYGDLKLVRSGAVSRSRTYRADCADGRVLFVKWAENDGRTAATFLSRHAGHPLLPQLLTHRPIPFEGGWVSVFEFRKLSHVRIEDMNDVQFESFCGGCEEVFGMMRSDGDLAQHRDYVSCMTMISTRVHDLGSVGVFFKSVVSMGKSDFEYASDVETQAIHDDFSWRNYAFLGNSLSTILDFDLLDTGSPVEPLASMIAQSIRRGEVWYGRGMRKVLSIRMRQLQARFGRGPEEWRVAINRIRIRDAEYFFQNHEKVGWRSAFSFARRDLRLRWLLGTVVG